MAQIKEKAKELGIVAGKMKKTDLIRAIQSKEGNFPCFETAKDYCNQLACTWREACLPDESLKKTIKEAPKKYIKKAKAELNDLSEKLGDIKKKSQKTLDQGKKNYEQTKNAYIKKTKAEMDELSTKLADLKKNFPAKLGKGKAEALEEIHKLEKKSAELKNKAHELAASGEEAWEVAKKGIDKAWHELSTSAHKALAKFK
ncbi:MAG: hypothetical protein OEY01_14460 [Desulfobulbaceae bacterium]|nr:hypothetical protein [Desulfobulbaceae bacterium]